MLVRKCLLSPLVLPINVQSCLLSLNIKAYDNDIKSSQHTYVICTLGKCIKFLLTKTKNRTLLSCHSEGFTFAGDIKMGSLKL